MDKLKKQKIVEDKDFLAILERTPEYKRMMKLTEKALLDQWNDVIYSGIINTIFKKYKIYIIKRGRKLKIQKSIAKATNEEELDEAEYEALSSDKFLVGEKDMKMTPYLLFLGGLIAGSLKSIGIYYDYRKNMNEFLKTMANKGGQSIVSLIKTPKPIKFRLSNTALKAKITQRVNNLIKGLDKVTKNNLVRHLSYGIKNRETKAQLVKRLQKTGKQFSVSRAKRIVQTETEAVAEFMRYETASINGVESRTWETVGDDRVCPICAPLDGVTRKMNKPFISGDFSGKYPPAHAVCRCSVTYDIEGNSAENFILKGGVFEVIEDMFNKAKQLTFYTPLSEKGMNVVNPNAIWAGGKTLVGPDRNITKFIEGIEVYRNYKNNLKAMIRVEEGKMIVDRILDEDIRVFGLDKIIVDARDKLTGEGFVQLIRYFGFTKKIPNKI